MGQNEGPLLSMAPMEGLTGHIFRRIHAECFGALDRYYTPFLTPPRLGSSFGKRDCGEVDPANNQGLNVVPQLLTKNATSSCGPPGCWRRWATARST